MGFDIDLESEEEPDQRPLKRRVWDDDVVLKRQFSALIPAFDPRPGRNNVAHTTDIEIPTPGEVHSNTVGGKITVASLLISIKSRQMFIHVEMKHINYLFVTIPRTILSRRNGWIASS